MKSPLSPFVLTLIWILLVGAAALVPLWWFVVNRSQSPSLVTQEETELLTSEALPAVEPIRTEQNLDETLTQLDEAKLDYFDEVLEKIDADATDF